MYVYLSTKETMLDLRNKYKSWQVYIHKYIQNYKKYSLKKYIILINVRKYLNVKINNLNINVTINKYKVCITLTSFILICRNVFQRLKISTSERYRDDRIRYSVFCTTSVTWYNFVHNMHFWIFFIGVRRGGLLGALCKIVYCLGSLQRFI
jgi:hypothetical protein